MQRPASLKVLVLGAAMAGLSLIGAGAANAQADVLRESAATVCAPQSASPDCQDVGPSTTRCQTNGSCQIVTAPRPQSERSVGVYGPFFWQNPGVGGTSPAVGSAAR